MSLQGIFDPIVNARYKKKYGGGGGEGGTEALDTLVKALMEQTPYELKSNAEGVIADDAFPSELITSVNLPSATSVGEGAFNQCYALTSVDLPSVTSVGLTAFKGCHALTSVNLPSATSIGESAFSGCYALTSVDLPSVTSIGSQAFASCLALTSVDLPSVTSIAGGAFLECSNLTTVILRTTSTVCVAELSSFNNTPLVQGKGHIYVPSAMYEYYRAGYEPAFEAAGYTGLFSIMFRKIEDYPEICGAN